MRMLQLALLLTVVLFSCFACASPPEKANEKTATGTKDANPPAPSVETKSVQYVDTKALYMDKCAICHGEDGKGVIKGAPNFTDKKWQQNESDRDLAAIIKNGKNAMPGFVGKLEAEQMIALVSYVRSFAK